MFNKINGLVHFTTEGFDINYLAAYKNEQMLNTYRALLNGEHNCSTAQMQLSFLGIDYQSSADKELNAINDLLKEKSGSKMNYSELKELKTRINVYLKNINKQGLFRMNKVNKTSSTELLNEWLFGAGINYYIHTEDLGGHDHKREYSVREYTPDEYDRKFIEYYRKHDLVAAKIVNVSDDETDEDEWTDL